MAMDWSLPVFFLFKLRLIQQDGLCHREYGWYDHSGRYQPGYRVVAMLPCDSGCHGVNFGTKSDGGYYAYVTNKLQPPGCS